MKTLNILTLLCPILLFSCKSTNNSENEIKIATEKMLEAGFIKGTIITSKIEGDCPSTIKIQGKEALYFLDPINLEENYKNDGEKIWFKFAGLRMMNRCDKANPISITEIVKSN